jgi:hypothetical protein
MAVIRALLFTIIVVFLFNKKIIGSVLGLKIETTAQITEKMFCCLFILLKWLLKKIIACAIFFVMFLLV